MPPLKLAVQAWHASATPLPKPDSHTAHSAGRDNEDGRRFSVETGGRHFWRREKMLNSLPPAPMCLNDL